MTVKRVQSKESISESKGSINQIVSENFVSEKNIFSKTYLNIMK